MKIVVYGTEHCPWCHRAKDFFKENGVEFKYIDVGKDRKAAEEMIEKTGQRGVPVIEMGKEIIIGFDEARIKKKLGLD